jgi:Ca2+/Na+ antiporter
MFNSLIFFFAYLLGNITINMGFAFGLFAVFAILRYRTDPIPIKEMTYLFIVITIGVINALSGNEVSYTVLLFTNITLVVLTYFLETYWQKNLLIRMTVEYEKIENIKPENRDALLADLKERTGLNIQSLEFRRMNFLRDTARIRIYYKE